MKSARMVRAGRGLVGWSQAELAQRSELSLPTIQRMENPQFGPLRSSAASSRKAAKGFRHSWCYLLRGERPRMRLLFSWERAASDGLRRWPTVQRRRDVTMHATEDGEVP